MKSKMLLKLMRGNLKLILVTNEAAILQFSNVNKYLYVPYIPIDYNLTTDERLKEFEKNIVMGFS